MALPSRVEVGSGTLPLLPNAARAEDLASPIYFLHVPKTAGTTFHRFVASQFLPSEICPTHLWHELINLPSEVLDQCTYIWGHFYAYLWRHASRPMRYMTFLRHPVERSLSHYGHIMRHDGHYLHARARELNDFGAFLRDPILSTTLQNFQVKSLALDLDPHSIAATLSQESLNQLLLEQTLETAKPALPVEEMLAIAQCRLDQMCFVGISERLEESVALSCAVFGWQTPPKVDSHNVNPERIQARDVRDSDLALLLELNAADMALYESATRLFDGARQALLRDEQTPNGV